MNERQSDAISVINNLIETCRDGEEGFRTAADSVEKSDLRTLFNRYSQQRAQFVAELQNEIRRMGGDPQETASIAGTLHRGWINLKSTITGGSESSIISECERGEDSAVRNYRDALDEELPADLRALVQSQYSQVKEAHDNIRSLERSYSAGAS
jgi:uncharacterized protein (TIGR02284 family)